MEATKAIIVGYYNNDFYMDISPDKIKDIIKEKFPIGKEVYVSKVYPSCTPEDYDACPHQGKCYRIIVKENDNTLSGQITCMINFKIIEEGAE